jgi:hypothetical protein
VDAILAILLNILDPEKQQSKFVSFSKPVGRAFVIFKIEFRVIRAEE